MQMAEYVILVGVCALVIGQGLMVGGRHHLFDYACSRDLLLMPAH